MPLLAGPTPQLVTLPVSGVTVTIATTYKDKLSITSELFGDGAGEDGKVAMTGEKFQAYQRRAVEVAVKSWDATDEDGKPIEISFEVVQGMDARDGEALLNAIGAMLTPSIPSPKGAK